MKRNTKGQFSKKTKNEDIENNANVIEEPPITTKSREYKTHSHRHKEDKKKW